MPRDITAASQHFPGRVPEPPKENKLVKQASQETGFDKLLREKNEKLKQLRKLVKGKPSITRAEIVAELGISMRCASRYLAEVRKDQKVVTGFDQLVATRKKNIAALKKLVKEHPETTVAERCKALGIVESTYRAYARAIRKGA